MRTIMARTPLDSSFSFSKRHLPWPTKKSASGSGGDAHKREGGVDDSPLGFAASSTGNGDDGRPAAAAAPKKKAPVSRFRAAFMAAILHRPGSGTGPGLGSRVTGTLFGRRRGHVHFAFQVDPRSAPVLLLELATPTSGLVREMATGLLRIALECEKKPYGAASDGGGTGGGKKGGAGARRLLEEPLWRTYCNGRKCGYAVRRECGPADWRVLRAVEPVSMGAGVLPAGDGEDDTSAAEGEMMYMRARFERVVGSRDSEAFYMMNPDGNGGPELSIYLLRV
uniref:Pleckstrin y domain-containing family M member 1 n=1 Tax=Anthurium amnicola TaxID=1678845 RepID=A0A1D1XPL0_9ARAE